MQGRLEFSGISPCGFQNTTWVGYFGIGFLDMEVIYPFTPPLHDNPPKFLPIERLYNSGSFNLLVLNIEFSIGSPLE